jgi:hypothetical protein
VNNRQERGVAAFRAAIHFFDTRRRAYAPELPILCARLQSHVAAINKVSAEQTARGGKLLGSARARLVRVRKDHMLPLARLARRLFRDEPAIQAALRVPHKQAPTKQLLDSAVSITKALRPHRKFLAESGVDPRRIERLREEARQVKKLLDAAYARTPTSVAATRKLPALFTAAREDLDAMDGIMRSVATGEDLVTWRTATRVGKRIGRPRKRRSG